MSLTHRDTCTPPACCSGSPGGTDTRNKMGRLAQDGCRKKGATYGVWKDCAGSDVDVRKLMGLNKAKMAQAMAAEPSWDAAEPHWLPGFPPHHYLPPCLVVVEVH